MLKYCVAVGPNPVGCNTLVYVIHNLATQQKDRIFHCRIMFVYHVDIDIITADHPF
jgi:hypothetical protein